MSEVSALSEDTSWSVRVRRQVSVSMTGEKEKRLVNIRHSSHSLLAPSLWGLLIPVFTLSSFSWTSTTRERNRTEDGINERERRHSVLQDVMKTLRDQNLQSAYNVYFLSLTHNLETDSNFTTLTTGLSYTQCSHTKGWWMSAFDGGLGINSYV